MDYIYICPICCEEHTSRREIMSFVNNDYYTMDCHYCGMFSMSKKMKEIAEAEGYEPRLSFWIREQNENDIDVFLDDRKAEEYYNIQDKALGAKYESLIRYCSKIQGITLFKGYSYEEKSNMDLRTITWSKNDLDVKMLIEKALRENHIMLDGKYEDRTEYIIKFEGKEFIENLGYKSNSNKIFMAFHFTDEMKLQFEPTIRKAVSDASHNKLEAVRVSSSTTDHDTKIDDELIGMLKSSKAVIADFTGNRTAVYYEAGYAMGLGIPVIWTCRETDVDNLSFDTRQYPHIIWKNEEDLYKQVVNRLKAKIL